MTRGRILLAILLAACAPLVFAADQVGDSAPSPAVRRLLTSQEVETAIRESLGPDNGKARIQILDFTRNPVVPGKLEFTKTGAVLSEFSDPRRPFLWRGNIRGDLGNNTPVWTRVQILVDRKVVRTKARLLAGQVLDAAELEATQEEACPLLVPVDEDISQYAGLSVRRSLAALTILNKNLVDTPPLVHRGTTVRVTVAAGRARITLDAEADSDGRLGQGIQITNIRTGRSFFGVVDGKGSVLVELASPAML